MLSIASLGLSVILLTWDLEFGEVPWIGLVLGLQDRDRLGSKFCKPKTLPDLI